MFTRQYGSCAICLRMVRVTLRGHRHDDSTTRRLFCKPCMTGPRSYDADPDVARFVATCRGRGADDGWH
jgi:hypothetical protein